LLIFTMTGPRHDLWVFGYGSLMWRPGFDPLEAVRARLTGYSRRLCVTSVHHRGSALRPGLVLGLDQGGVCEGVAYRVAAADAAGVLAYLRAREQVNGVYREAFVPIEIEGERHEIVQAVTYLVERAHPSYSGRLPLMIQARIIRGARGLSGANVDYVINTLAHMAAMGIRERELERLLVVLGAFFSRDDGEGFVSARAEVLRRASVGSGLLSGYQRRMRPEQRRRFVYRQKIS
jgi:cation transport protein ChaC